ncbi:MAG TPA: hypothetical protein VGN81_21500 [Pseudonocardiaceae bacterium]
MTLGMALRLAQRRLGTGTVDVDELLDHGVAELGTAVAELRQIAHGLRPSSLDDGLGPALAALASTMPLSIELDVQAGELPEDIAITAYYVVTEAITNAAKHAQAGSIAVRVGRLDGHCGSRSPMTGSAARQRARAPASPDWVTGSPRQAAPSRSAAPSARAHRWRRCCRAHGDR